MLRTLLSRKCGRSDLRARRDDVKCEKSLAYKKLKRGHTKQLRQAYIVFKLTTLPLLKRALRHGEYHEQYKREAKTLHKAQSQHSALPSRLTERKAE